MHQSAPMGEWLEKWMQHRVFGDLQTVRTELMQEVCAVVPKKLAGMPASALTMSLGICGSGDMGVFHLLKSICLFSPVGFQGNLSLYTFVFAIGLNQMEGVQLGDASKMPGVLLVSCQPKKGFPHMRDRPIEYNVAVAMLTWLTHEQPICKL